MSSVLLASPVARTQTDTETDAEAQTKTDRHADADVRDHPRTFPTFLPHIHTAQTHTARTHVSTHASARAHSLSHIVVPTHIERTFYLIHMSHMKSFK
jgi:hypothetical protein